MQRAEAPPQMWDYAFELAADILSLTSKSSLIYGNQPGYQWITNLKPDISQHASFGFYNWIWYLDEVQKVKQLGRWLRVSENVGPIMTFWILTTECTVIPRSIVISLLPSEMDSSLIRERMAEFNNNIQAKLNARYYSLDVSAGLYQTDSIIDVQRGSRSLGETFTTRDL